MPGVPLDSPDTKYMPFPDVSTSRADWDRMPTVELSVEYTSFEMVYLTRPP